MTEAASTSEPTGRKAIVLNLVVGDYIRTAAPVGSGHVAMHHSLGVSPATVRNDMAELEDEGYISRRHTSGGGMPSDKGYRFYVEHMDRSLPPPPRMQWLVRQRFPVVEREPEAWSRMAAAILAQVVQNVAIVTVPRAAQPRLRHLQLVRLQEFLALLILVFHTARVRQQLLPLPQDVDQEEMMTMANKLNALFAGKSRQQVSMAEEELSPLEARVMREAGSLMEAEERAAFANVWVEGLKHLLGQPEFATGQRAKDAAQVVEDRELMSSVLTAVQGSDDVCVIIGEEHGRDDLRSFSMVLCQYGIPGDSVGVVGAMGPTRMDYATSIGGVRYLSLYLSRLLSGLQGPRV